MTGGSLFRELLSPPSERLVSSDILRLLQEEPNFASSLRLIEKSADDTHSLIGEGSAWDT